MSSSPKKTQMKKTVSQIDDKEEPIPFLVYDSNTKSNLYIANISHLHKYSIYFN